MFLYGHFQNRHTPLSNRQQWPVWESGLLIHASPVLTDQLSLLGHKPNAASGASHILSLPRFPLNCLMERRGIVFSDSYAREAGLGVDSDDDRRVDLGCAVGIVRMSARRTALTDSGVVKTSEISGSSMTTTWLLSTCPANRLGRALR